MPECRSADSGNGRWHRGRRPDQRNRARGALACRRTVVLAARTADTLHVALLERCVRRSTATTWRANRAATVTFDVAVGDSRDRRCRRRRRADPARRVGALHADYRCARCGVPNSRSPTPASGCSSGVRSASSRPCSIRWPPWPVRSNVPAPQQIWRSPRRPTTASTSPRPTTP